MATLQRPNNCICGSQSMHRELHPERWVCDKCNSIIITRSLKPDPTKCRECGKGRDEVEFSKTSNICLPCKRDYNKVYGEENKEKIRLQHKESYQRDKPKRQAAVRDCIQSSPEHFLTYLAQRSRLRSGRKPKGVDFIQREMLLDLYAKQNGKCAVTGLQMTHSYYDLKSISVDRLDCSKGYEPDNVRLVCKFVNLARGDSPVGELEKVFEEMRINVCSNRSY